MTDKLRSLNYKPIIEFDTHYDRLTHLVSNHYQPAGSEFYAKIIEQRLEYELNNGSHITNTISLALFFLIQDDTVLDCLAIPSFPIQIRFDTDYQALTQLYEIFKSDISEVMNYENSIPIN